MIDAMPVAGDLLSALRTATAAAHRTLEDAVGIPRRLLKVAEYRQLLVTFLGFYRPLERALWAAGDWNSCGLDLTGRQKTPWLAGDLQALGVDAAALPDCGRMPAIDDLAQGLGCLYVLEGATLGGRQITGMMEGSPVPPDARRFFASYGAETGLRWQEFLAALKSFEGRSAEWERAELVEAATDTFRALQLWLEECEGRP